MELGFQSFTEPRQIDCHLNVDSRGSLEEVFKPEIAKLFDNFNCQLELEVKSKKDVIRGLHYQLNNFAQAKIVRVTYGIIFDVVVDLRKSSPKFGKLNCRLLNAKEPKLLYIPRGYAHGYQVIEDACVNYKLDNDFNEQNSRGLLFNDPDLSIPWPPCRAPILSEKDKNFPRFIYAEYYD